MIFHGLLRTSFLYSNIYRHCPHYANTVSFNKLVSFCSVDTCRSKELVVMEINKYIKTYRPFSLLSFQDISLQYSDWCIIHDNFKDSPHWISILWDNKNVPYYPMLTLSLLEYFMSQTSLHTSGTLSRALFVLDMLPKTQQCITFQYKLWTLLKLNVDKDEITKKTVGLRMVSLGSKMKDHWWEAVDYMKYLSPSSLANLMNLLIAAAKWGSIHQFETVLNGFSVISTNTIINHQDELLAALEISPDHSDLNEASQKMFLFLNMLKTNKLVVDEGFGEALHKWFSSYPGKEWSSTWDAPVRKSTCMACSKPLPSSMLTDKEMEILQENIWKYVIEREDIYYATQPNELRFFQTFLKMNAINRFDCVLDICNIIHGYTATTIILQRLNNLLRELHRSYGVKNILLCGKKDFQRLQIEPIVIGMCNDLELTVRQFTTCSSSKDDVFTLYCAVWSGPQCYVVSCDEYRAEKALLPTPEIRHLFKRWQASHQFRLLTPQAGKSFIKPRNYELLVDGNVEDGWHIPCISKPDDKRQSLLTSYALPHKWLCVQRCK